MLKKMTDVDYSQDGGQQLVAVDDANEHSISVWDLSRDRPHKITETKVKWLICF